MQTTNREAKAAAERLLIVAEHVETGEVPGQVRRIIDDELLHGPPQPDNPHPPGWLSTRYTELQDTGGNEGREESATIQTALRVLGKIMHDKGRLPDDPAQCQRLVTALKRAARPYLDGDGQGTETAGGKRSSKKGRATINARIIELLQTTPEAAGWSARKIATHLRCGKSAVASAPTFRVLEVEREKVRAEQATSQRRNRKRLHAKPLSGPDKTR